MPLLKKIGRVLLIVIAVLVIILCLGGIVGAWWANSVAANATLQVFSVIDTGVSVVESGVERVNSLVAESRAEVQQAEETINTVSANVQENSPVLTALSSRLQERLEPRVTNIQQTLAPVRDAVVEANSAVQFANSIPFMSRQFPVLVKLDAAFDTLGQLAADVRQLNDTLRATITAEKNELTQESTTVLTGITTRIDTRLGEVETRVQETAANIDALQARSAALKSRLLLIYNLAALSATLLMIWLVYSQIVVVRQQWSRLRSPAVASIALPSPDDGAATAALSPVTPVEVEAVAAPVTVSEAAGVLPEMIDPPAPTSQPAP